MDTNNIFLDKGKITTTAKFWEIGADTLVTTGGITPGFSKMLGEQIFLPVKGLSKPFYTAFAGRPISNGAGWMEGLRYKTTTYKRKPKATAEDNFKFYESGGMEKVYNISVDGWKPITIPSDLDMSELIMNGSTKQINDILYAGAIEDYNEEIESDIQMKAIMTASKSETVDITDFAKVRKLIRTTASKMRGEKTNYTDLTDEVKAKINTGSKEVLCFIPEILLGDMTSDEAGLPSPEKLVNNATIIPIPDDLATPLTTAQWGDGVTNQGWDTTKPTTVDTVAPQIFMCSRDRIEYRPYINEYKVNPAPNGAGDFTNYHILWKGTIGIRPWENAVRIMDD